jgi:hypothetical protein
VNPDIAQLEQIDPVHFQSVECGIPRTRDRFRRKILRDYTPDDGVASTLPMPSDSALKTDSISVFLN